MLQNLKLQKLIILIKILEQGGGRNSHDESSREQRKRSAIGSNRGAAAAAGRVQAADAQADPEDDQSLIEIKDSVA